MITKIKWYLSLTKSSITQLVTITVFLGFFLALNEDCFQQWEKLEGAFFTFSFILFRMYFNCFVNFVCGCVCNELCF